MPAFKFCPRCEERVPLVKNEQGYMACQKCTFVHYDNPVPVVAIVVPMIHKYLKTAGISTIGIPDGGIVLVQRAIPPFKDEWCLPCGFMERHGHPKAEAAREVREESGLITRMEQILGACNPMPGEINQMVLSYLARPVGGTLRAGDDAADVRVFDQNNLPNICFRSHRMLVDQWFAGSFGTLTGKDLLV